MAGTFYDQPSDYTDDMTKARLMFDFADWNGHEIRIMFAYRLYDWLNGYVEIWRTDHKSTNTRVRVMSNLLHELPDNIFDEMALFEHRVTPDEINANCTLKVARVVIGADRDDSDDSYLANRLWRIHDEFRDVDMFNGTFTDCHGNRYRITAGKAKAYVNGLPPILPEFAEQPQQTVELDDIPF